MTARTDAFFDLTKPIAAAVWDFTVLVRGGSLQSSTFAFQCYNETYASAWYLLDDAIVGFIASKVAPLASMAFASYDGQAVWHAPHDEAELQLTWRAAAAARECGLVFRRLDDPVWLSDVEGMPLAARVFESDYG